jgi:hypothetical protein
MTTTRMKKTNAASGSAWIRCQDEMPDADLTVMIHHAGEDEPVWMGYHDGETWRMVDGARCSSLTLDAATGGAERRTLRRGAFGAVTC